MLSEIRTFSAFACSIIAGRVVPTVLILYVDDSIPAQHARITLPLLVHFRHSQYITSSVTLSIVETTYFWGFKVDFLHKIGGGEKILDFS